MGKNRKLRKRIQSELNVINEHIDKIAEELLEPYPDRRNIEKWEKDIANHQKRLVELTDKLPGRKS